MEFGELFAKQINSVGLFSLSAAANDSNTDTTVVGNILEECSEQDFLNAINLKILVDSNAMLEFDELSMITNTYSTYEEAVENLDAIMFSLKHAYERGMPSTVGDIELSRRAQIYEQSLIDDLTAQSTDVAYNDEIDMLIEFGETGLLKHLKQSYIDAGVDVPDRLLSY